MVCSSRPGGSIKPWKIEGEIYFSSASLSRVTVVHSKHTHEFIIRNRSIGGSISTHGADIFVRIRLCGRTVVEVDPHNTRFCFRESPPTQGGR